MPGRAESASPGRRLASVNKTNWGYRIVLVVVLVLVLDIAKDSEEEDENEDEED